MHSGTRYTQFLSYLSLIIDILFSNPHTHSLFLLRLESRDPGVWRCQDCIKITCVSECLRVKVTWGSTQSRSCWGREPLGRPGWLSPMRAAGAFFSLKSGFYHIMYQLCTTYVPMSFFKVLRYEGVVFVGVGVEGERRQHDRGWTLFNPTAVNSNTILFNTVETSILSGQYFVQLQSCQYSEVWIEFKHCYW